jgi:hypothetical protein
MWYQHALHGPSDYVAHHAPVSGGRNFYFAQHINLTIDALIATW